MRIATAKEVEQAFAKAHSFPVARVTSCDCCGEMALCSSLHDVYDVPACISCIVEHVLTDKGLRLATEADRREAALNKLAEESASGFGI